MHSTIHNIIIGSFCPEIRNLFYGYLAFVLCILYFRHPRFAIRNIFSVIPANCYIFAAGIPKTENKNMMINIWMTQPMQQTPTARNVLV